MKSKGFKIRSLASAINQRQGFLGVRLGFRVQNKLLKQQVQSPLYRMEQGDVGQRKSGKKNNRVQSRTRDIL